MLPRRQNTLEQRLNRSFGEVIAKRGRQLWEDGCVGASSQSPLPDGAVVYVAVVRGSSGSVYSTSLIVDAESIESDCSCPYARDCKHGAALALAVLQESDSGRQVDELDLWLGELDLGGQAEVAGRTSQRWHLFYLIDFQVEPPTLVLSERYLKQDGGWGRSQSVSIYSLGMRLNLEPAEREMAQLLKAAAEPSWASGGYYSNSAVQLREAVGALLLERALVSGRALDARTREPLHLEPARTLSFAWHEQAKRSRLQPQLSPSPDQPYQILPLSPPWWHSGNCMGPAQSELDATALQPLLNMPWIPADRLKAVSINLTRNLGDSLPLANEEWRLQTLTDFQPSITLCAWPSRVGPLPGLRLQAQYGPCTCSINSELGGTISELVEQGDQQYQLVRDLDKEREVAQMFAAQGLVCASAEGKLFWVPPAAEPAEYVAQWHRSLPAIEQLCNEQGWQVEIDASYTTGKRRASLDAQVSKHSGGWFDLALGFDFGDASLNPSEIIGQWLEAGSPDSLPTQNQNGDWLVLDMAQLKPVLSTLMELYGGGGVDAPARLPAFKALELEALESVNYKQAPSLKTLQQKLKNFAGLKPVAPNKKLQAELRDYQLHGLSWLTFLHSYGFGGILADDMGLGKTLQTLAFIQKLKAGRKLTNGALVVAPTSLIWNWQSEAARFTPNLTCLTLHGLERKTRFDQIAESDVVITSYALIQRDSEVYEQHDFDITILDEAQNIKNSHAKTTQAVKRLPSGMRLCLTGTPLENHLGELWSLADYVLPGLLGSREHFNRYFRHSIERDGNAEIGAELSRRMAPFMLRRTKTEVVRELPQKTETVQTVHLEKQQKALYESIRVSMKKRVRDLIAQKGVARSHIEFLDALLKLRQACIDPRLVKLEQAKKVKQSAKMQWLRQTLPELVQEGRKILIFSQFTQMLDLIECELNALAITPVKLTGRTRKRKEVIDAFQNGAAPVFLVSLKAGGSGLNLTAADTVVHVDPWWNPAVENQATDRAYRIGQDKPVFVYKLVAAGTVEERIQELQQQKQALADNLFDQSKKAKSPRSGDELLALFRD